MKKSIKKQNIPLGSDYALGWDTPSLNGNSSAGDYFSKLSFGHLGFTEHLFGLIQMSNFYYSFN